MITRGRSPYGPVGTVVAICLGLAAFLSGVFGRPPDGVTCAWVEIIAAVAEIAVAIIGAAISSSEDEDALKESKRQARMRADEEMRASRLEYKQNRLELRQQKAQLKQQKDIAKENERVRQQQAKEAERATREEGRRALTAAFKPPENVLQEEQVEKNQQVAKWGLI